MMSDKELWEWIILSWWTTISGEQHIHSINIIYKWVGARKDEGDTKTAFHMPYKKLLIKLECLVFSDNPQPQPCPPDLTLVSLSQCDKVLIWDFSVKSAHSWLIIISSYLQVCL